MAKRPMTVEDMWAVKRVGVPSLSPDGRWAAVEVVSYDMSEGAIDRTACGDSSRRRQVGTAAGWQALASSGLERLPARAVKHVGQLLRVERPEVLRDLLAALASATRLRNEGAAVRLANVSSDDFKKILRVTAIVSFPFTLYILFESVSLRRV